LGIILQEKTFINYIQLYSNIILVEWKCLNRNIFYVFKLLLKVSRTAMLSITHLDYV